MARALREIFADFSVSFDKRRNLARGNRLVSQTKRVVAGAKPHVDRLTRGLQAMGIALGGAAIVHAMHSFITNTIAMGDELDKTSQQLGISAHDLQSFRLAAELSGAGTEQMNVALGQLANKLYQAHTIGGSMEDLFRDIGVAFEDDAGNMRELQEVMDDVADSLQRTENPTERVGIAMQLFGRSGRTLLPMLQGGSEALAGMRQELDDLGGGMSTLAIQQSVELTDSITRMKLSWLSLRGELAMRFMPTIDFLIQKGTQLGRWMASVTDQSHILESTLIALGAAIAAAGIVATISWGPVILTVVGVGLAFVGLALAIDDVWTTLEGGDSLIKRVVDGLFGIGTTAWAIHQVATMIHDLVAYFSTLRAEIEGVSSVWSAWAASASTAVSGFIDRLIELNLQFLDFIGIGEEVRASIGDAFMSVALMVDNFVAAVERAVDRLLQLHGISSGIRDIIGSVIGGVRSAGATVAENASPIAPLRQMRAIGQQERIRRAQGLQAKGQAWRATRPQGTGARLMADREDLPSYGTGAMLREVPSRGGQNVENNIDASMQVQVDIREATDAAEVDRRVRVAIREEGARRVREIQGALVREPSR